MTREQEYEGGENFDLRDVLLNGRGRPLQERTAQFGAFLNGLREQKNMLCMRTISSPTDREVTVVDPFTGVPRPMLMFGSNNYLGLATHPHVRERVESALRDFGVGVGGPPLLNGTTSIHRELEERLAALKGTEDAMLFSSGYGANVGLTTGLMSSSDIVLFDAYSHASFTDGLKMAGTQSFRFAHNDLHHLEQLFEMTATRRHTDLFVGVEGVYSMDGDVAPLDRLLPLCESHGAILVLDDAHGTGVMGESGRGTAEHFGLEGTIPLTMGTFSKAFAVTGGFVAGSAAVISYLRFFARSHMFSAALPPPIIAAVLGGLEVLEREPERLSQLRENIARAARGLQELGFDVLPSSAILPLRVPVNMDIRQASLAFHERGIFVNSIEYPAVPVAQQRFRISLMATHTHDDIRRLLTAVQEVWSSCVNQPGADCHDTSCLHAA
jgi:glycine C-acetyltransferase